MSSVEAFHGPFAPKVISIIDTFPNELLVNLYNILYLSNNIMKCLISWYIMMFDYNAIFRLWKSAPDHDFYYFLCKQFFISWVTVLVGLTNICKPQVLTNMCIWLGWRGYMIIWIRYSEKLNVVTALDFITT